ncbi:MAG: aldose epimerase family protein [Bacillota bacterium]
MQVVRVPFGVTSRGEEVSAFRLSNSSGVTAEVISYGATLRCLHVPDNLGRTADIVLGYDDIAGYEADRCFLGAVGRVCGRIPGARFLVNGAPYEVAANDGQNHLHGGNVGFNKRLWSANIHDDGVTFSRVSPDGEEGYPGTLHVSVRYRLLEDCSLRIEYAAAAEQATVASLTNHSYFNLAGHDSGDVLAQQLQIRASRFAEARPDLIPTGELPPVAGTPLDFTSQKPIGRDIRAEYPQVSRFGGYDHAYALDEANNGLRQVAYATDPASGRRMRVYTDLPGMQFYSANFLDAMGKSGAHYGRYGAFCLETQHFPASASGDFAGITLQAGETWQSATVFQFEWQ